MGRRTEPARGHRPDYRLIVLPLLLSILGVIVLVAVSPALAALAGVGETYYPIRHGIALLIGTLAAIAASRLPFSWWRQAVWPLAGIAVGLSIVALIIGGLANRWVVVGGFSFQPVELVKLAVLIGMAWYLGNALKQRGRIDTLDLKRVGIVMGAIAVMTVIVQRDLGSMVVIAVMVATMLVIARIPLRWLMALGAVTALLGIMAVVAQPYRMERIAVFFGQSQDCDAEAYHSCQALIAIGSGGVFGKGIGSSVQAYGYLPEANTDSIGSIIAEMFGFVGMILFLLCYGSILALLLVLARRSAEWPARLFLSGLFAWLFAQAAINLGGMVGLLPIKGIPLPFVSYGGSSLLAVLTAVGIAFQLSRQTSLRAVEPSVGSAERENSSRRGERMSYATHLPGGWRNRGTYISARHDR